MEIKLEAALSGSKWWNPKLRRPSTAGQWRSADKRWLFRRMKSGWAIRASYLTGSYHEDAAFLAWLGLDSAIFPTRRQAVETLQLALS